MKIYTVVGARPQFIKAAAVSRAVACWNESNSRKISEKIIHTGQHYDDEMSDVFFSELKIPRPWKNLEVGSAPHGKQTGIIMERLEELVMADSPDLLLTYGDTNSTLASALVAAKLHVPVAHVEAGLRSFNRLMPEEINRVVTDHVSKWLFCPSAVSAENLQAEGVVEGVHIVGDVMYDALLFNKKISDANSKVLQQYGFEPGQYYAATIHRAESTDQCEILTGIINALELIGNTVVLPLHPRTRKCLEQFSIELPANIVAIPPLPYLDMIQLVSNSIAVLTDSGGLQKEAVWLGKPCITLRTETEWTELVDIGWNSVVGFDTEKILAAVKAETPSTEAKKVYGEGDAANKILDIIMSTTK